MSMVDLNLWRLKYPGVDFEFGTHESGYPFTKQVDVGAVQLETNDLDHPLSDGLVFGVDILRGRTLNFAGAHHLPLRTPKHYRHERPLDLGNALETAWRGDWLRGRAGRVASLTNEDRGRVVYGRPRNYAADLTRVRHGWSTWAADFATVDNRFYDADEKVTTVGLAPGSVGGIAAPFEVPLTTTSATGAPTALVDNDGTLPTWPVLELAGPTANPRLELLTQGGSTLWWIKLAATLEADETVVIDCRPWVRTVLRNGSNANGLLRGSTMNACTVPPGATELKLTGTDETGTSTATIRWRDAYAGL